MGEFKSEHPSLFSELAPGQPAADSVTSGSGIQFHWICPKGHDYVTSPRRRVYGNACPYCSGSRVLAGFNDVATTHPQIVQFWADATTLPSQVGAGSRNKVSWKCSEGHTKVAEVREVTKNGMKCRPCSEQKRQSSSPHLKDVPELALELAPGQQELLSLRTHSSVVASWVCAEGHSYPASIKNRNLGRGCPYCAGVKVLAGFNDLATTHPSLVSAWGCSEAKTVSAGSEREVTWNCPQGHQFTRSVASMVKSPTCVYCSGTKVLAGFNDLATTHPHLTPEWELLPGGVTPNQVSAGSGFIASWRCPDGNHVYPMRVSDRARSTPRGCPACLSSTGEREIREWLTSLGLTVVTNSRSIISPLEIDLYLPDHKLGIEYNGLYWHSESNGKGSEYHLGKVEASKKAGIQLIQVWEDDWFTRKAVIQKMILRKIGSSTEPKVGARKTKPVNLPAQAAKDFMESNHVQGFKASTQHLGLQDRDGQVVAVASFRKQQSVWYLERYATSQIVQGGFTKLLRHFQSLHLTGELITFADQEVSDGSLYRAHGFELDSILPPDYSYMYAGKRCHKFGFRKRRFEEDPALKFAPDLTESQLAELNNMPRIWDSGKLRFVLSWSNS